LSLHASFIKVFFDFLAEWQTFLILSSLGSMILGSLSGLAQQKIKRLFAYSGIGHVGYLLIALSCGSVESLQALVVYLVIYMIMTVNLFTLLLTPVRRSEFSEVSRIKYTTDLALLGKTNPLLAASFTIGLFSLAGIPPLAGFYSKAFLFWTALNSSQYLLALVGIFTSVISCFYYIRMIKIMYFETPKEWISFHPVSKAGSLVLGLTTLFLLFFMIYPSPLSLASHKVALALSI
jgi:NADH-quinone oxidoreductase subunit N